MSFIVYITEDFERMSEVAAGILIPKMQVATVDKLSHFNLGLATGNSPTGLCDKIVARQDEFNPRMVRSWNLDEYVGLPGDTASERVQHPESYAYFMISHLFGRLDPTFLERNVPAGTEIEQNELEQALSESSQYVQMDGTDKGKAVRISEECDNPYLNFIQTKILQAYVGDIRRKGGIDYWVVGSGGKGHIAFHESGISLNHEIMLVKLDDNTVDNAVADGHFPTREKAPNYAISMGAKGVVSYSKNVLLLANGERKTGPIADSLLGVETADVPISILQRNILEEYKHTIYVLDEIAARGILGKKRVLADKGIQIKDIRV